MTSRSFSDKGPVSTVPFRRDPLDDVTKLTRRDIADVVHRHNGDALAAAAEISTRAMKQLSSVRLRVDRDGKRVTRFARDAHGFERDEDGNVLNPPAPSMTEAQLARWKERMRIVGVTFDKLRASDDERDEVLRRWIELHGPDRLPSQDELVEVVNWRRKAARKGQP